MYVRHSGSLHWRRQPGTAHLQPTGPHSFVPIGAFAMVRAERAWPSILHDPLNADCARPQPLFFRPPTQPASPCPRARDTRTGPGTGRRSRGRRLVSRSTAIARWSAARLAVSARVRTGTGLNGQMSPPPTVQPAAWGREGTRGRHTTQPAMRRGGSRGGREREGGAEREGMGKGGTARDAVH